MITVPEVCRAMGVEPEPALTWPVGNAARDHYVRVCGDLPMKALRTKTCGIGSHCFAIYPDEMRPIIEDIIRAHRASAARQGDLFPPEPK